MSAARLCRYAPCACQPPPERAYCDSSCEARDRPGGETLQEECICGHPECRPEYAEDVGADSPN